MQELDGPLPGKASRFSIIFRAILLDKPMSGSWISIEDVLLASRLKLLLHCYNRLSRHKLVLLRKVAEICSRSFVIRQSGVGVVKCHNGGDLLSKGDGRIQRIGTAQRETNEGELVAIV